MGTHIAKKEWDKAHAKGCVRKCRGGKDAYVKSANPHAYRSNAHEQCKAKDPGIYNIDFTKAPHEGRLTTILGGANSFSESAHGKGTRRKVADPRKNANAWRLDHGKNFQKGYLPYNHDSHHMIPCEALAEVYEPQELLLLMLAGYHVNEKGNMIILPKTEIVSQALMLLRHWSNHQQYTAFVMAQLQSIRFMITEASDKHQVTDSNKGEIKTELENLQPELWDILVNLGKASAAAVKMPDLEEFDSLMA